MMMLTLFSISNLLFHESGLLTVTVMGAWLANMRGVPTRPIIEFKETLSVLLISGLFILLAARLTVDQLALLGWPAWAFLFVLLGVARPLMVWVCTLAVSWISAKRPCSPSSRHAASWPPPRRRCSRFAWRRSACPGPRCWCR